MKKRELTKEQMLEKIAYCYEIAGNSDTFFSFFKDYGIKTYEQKGHVEGIVIDGANVSLESLGYSREVIQALDSMAFTDEDRALLDQYRDPTEMGEHQVRVSDLIPSLTQSEEEQETERISEREEELDDIRGKEGEDKELDQGMER